VLVKIWPGLSFPQSCFEEGFQRSCYPVITWGEQSCQNRQVVVAWQVTCPEEALLFLSLGLGPGDVAQVVEHLSSKYGTLSSIPQYLQKKRKEVFKYLLQGWPWTQDPSASPFAVLGLQACTMPGSCFLFSDLGLKPRQALYTKLQSQALHADYFELKEIGRASEARGSPWPYPTLLSPPISSLKQVKELLSGKARYKTYRVTLSLLPWRPSLQRGSASQGRGGQGRSDTQRGQEESEWTGLAGCNPQFIIIMSFPSSSPISLYIYTYSLSLSLSPLPPISSLSPVEDWTQSHGTCLTRLSIFHSTFTAQRPTPAIYGVLGILNIWSKGN
jgi:hypothetical protein